MNAPRYASAVAKLMRKHLPVPSALEADEERAVATIELAMRARARRRWLVGAAGALAVAAAALLVASQLKRAQPATTSGSPLVSIRVSPAGSGAALDVGAREQPLEAHAALGSGQRIETAPGGGASLQLSTGTSMDLAGRTSFRVDSQGAVQRFSLQQGELSAHVAKLAATQRFIIDTPDAEIEVRGTRFRLQVLALGDSCGGGSRTRLEVTEGVVQARAAGSRVDVRAGESWPTDCRSELDAPTASSTAVAGVLPLRAGATPHGDARPAAERLSALAPQNDLFAEGIAGRRRGDVSGALRAFQELLSRFPNGPLAENAMVERMRLLAGSPEASTEAKRYLSRYPQGFAAAEAQKLLAGP